VNIVSRRQSARRYFETLDDVVARGIGFQMH